MEAKFVLPPGAESVEIRIDEKYGLVYLAVKLAHGRVQHGQTKCLTDGVVDFDRHGCFQGLDLLMSDVEQIIVIRRSEKIDLICRHLKLY